MILVTRISSLLTAKQDKVLESYFKNDWDILVLNGAVRSGKTYIDNWIFLLELKRVQKQAKEDHNSNPQYILAGYSSSMMT